MSRRAIQAPRQLGRCAYGPDRSHSGCDRGRGPTLMISGPGATGDRGTARAQYLADDEVRVEEAGGRVDLAEPGKEARDPD